ncbi:adenosylcobinamide-GDP ribazoletransferase [Roseospirillum parvum]|uniref:Adenosylcobinamide-GDP ribazoletransferase n=1 Tax=Roseospirillum parvum TaxID=83401 RepID=A0A1G8FXV2_9PROT|nr:adenosylcobinamide-GDP ribazoletransferase [Roseospirillum parvum]SDH86953.1 adenosylcobinamide-GDP ribazoletransferase [Roseospirillum parvum]
MSDQPPLTAARLGYDLRLAAAFLTRLPIAWPSPPGGGDPPPMASVMWAFPLVGAGLGLAAGGVMLGGLWLGLPPLAAALLALAGLVVVTGCLHEDGLADVCDGLGVRPGPDGDLTRRLEVLRDSRLGSFGALGLIFSIGLKAAALVALGGAAPLALALALALERGIMPLIMHTLPAARGDGVGAGFGRPSRPVAGTALALSLLVALPLGGAGVAAFAAGVGLAAAAMIAARRLFGGFTGDVVGAIGQLVAVVILLVLAALVGSPS